MRHRGNLWAFVVYINEWKEYNKTKETWDFKDDEFCNLYLTSRKKHFLGDAQINKPDNFVTLNEF
jgi:hypothetical protein